jgi:hypothetical protein
LCSSVFSRAFSLDCELKKRQEIGGKERKGGGDREPGDTTRESEQRGNKRKKEKKETRERKDKRNKRKKRKKQRKEREKGACSPSAVQKQRVRERERCV